MRLSSVQFIRFGASILLAFVFSVSSYAGGSWATQVVAYEPGFNPEPGYSNVESVLGQPERYTGEGVWPGVVTPFNPPWTASEILSIGSSGSLTVRFDQAITDDPSHLYGVDLILFGNGGFIDAAWPAGEVGGLLEDGPFTVSVSADGNQFFALAGELHDAMFPMLGYADLTDPYATEPGDVPTDYTKPMDPSLTYDDFLGKSFSEIVAMYDGSGGGIPVDIAGCGLSSVQYVRIDVLAGATSVEFDAFAVVPEPSTLAIFGLLVLGALRRKHT